MLGSARDHYGCRAEIPMNMPLSPLVSESGTTEQEASYAVRLQSQVAASLAEPRQPIPHDEVVSETDALIIRLKAHQQG